jgi:hypothetical protein
MSIKTFFAAEVRTGGKTYYVSSGGKLSPTPRFFSAVSMLQHYLDRRYRRYGKRYNAATMEKDTHIIKMTVNGTMLQPGRVEAMTVDTFLDLKKASSAVTYSAYATFRLRRANGQWVNTRSSSGKFGKTWTTPGALRRHLGDRISWLKRDYAGAVVHVTIYDHEGIKVVETKQIPVIEFFTQSPIYSKKWDAVNTPTTLSLGELAGRLTKTELV